MGGRGGYGGGGSYILLRNKLQSHHEDMVIMSVSWTDEQRTKMRSQSVKCDSSADKVLLSQLYREIQCWFVED